MIHLVQAGQSETSALFDLTDRGLLLADGVFDTSMVRGGRMVFREVHLARLLRDAEALEIDIEQEPVQAAIETALQGIGDASLRITITRGPGARGLAGEPVGPPTILTRTAPLDHARCFAPVRLAASVITRNAGSLTSRHKTLAYTDQIMAAREAVRAGADEALMLNGAGRVACASSGNIFVRSGDDLITPPVSEAVLPGIIRGWLLRNGDDLGLTCTEAPLSVDALMGADQVFMTNSLRLIAPVSQIDGHVFDPELPKQVRAALETAIEAAP